MTEIQLPCCEATAMVETLEATMGNPRAIGIGMIPRGEVGLIMAGIGATLTLPGAHGVNETVIGAATFGAVVIMVIVTTIVTPPLLKWSLTRSASQSDAGRTNRVLCEVADEAVERTPKKLSGYGSISQGGG